MSAPKADIREQLLHAFGVTRRLVDYRRWQLPDRRQIRHQTFSFPDREPAQFRFYSLASASVRSLDLDRARTEADVGNRR